MRAKVEDEAAGLPRAHQHGHVSVGAVGAVVNLGDHDCHEAVLGVFIPKGDGSEAWRRGKELLGIEVGASLCMYEYYLA